MAGHVPGRREPDHEIPDDLAIAYFYMPFPTSVFEHVVAGIARSLERRPRRFRIIYLERAPTDEDVPGRFGFRKLVQRRRMAVHGVDPTIAQVIR